MPRPGRKPKGKQLADDRKFYKRDFRRLSSREKGNAIRWGKEKAKRRRR